MATVNQLPSGAWRAQIRRKGLAALSKTCKTKQEAESWANLKESELLVTHHKVAPHVAQVGTLSSVIEKYFNSTVFRNKAPSTQSRERCCSTRILECLGHYAITAIDGMAVQDYLDARGSEHVRHANGKIRDNLVSPNTIRLEKAFLSAVFKWAKSRKYVTSNIMADTFDLPTCYPREGRISEAQQLKLYEEAGYLQDTPGTNPCLMAWLYFVFDTGTRPGEAAKIELSWVDLEKRRVNIPRRGSKKRNPRIILLSDALTSVVAECMANAYGAGSNYLFFSRANARRQKRADGTPVRRIRTPTETAERECIPYKYYHAWRNLCRHAGVPETINPHIMRHEFICRLFEMTNMSDSQIAVLVGDVNVLSLDPYKHVLVERLREHHDAHLEGMRKTLEALEVKRLADIEAFRAHLNKVRREAQEEREQRGDFSTPMERLHASIMAAKAVEEASSGKLAED